MKTIIGQAFFLVCTVLLEATYANINGTKDISILIVFGIPLGVCAFVVFLMGITEPKKVQRDETLYLKRPKRRKSIYK
jgi:hypothetical protein